MQDKSISPRQRNFIIATAGLLIAVPLIWHGCGGGFGDDDDEFGVEAGEEAGDEGNSGAEGGGASQGGSQGDGDGDDSDSDSNGDGDGDDSDSDSDGDGDGDDDYRPGDGTCVPLIAGQHTKAGVVCVSVDYDVDTSQACEAEGTKGVLRAIYATRDDWELKEAHFVAGDEFGDIPLNNAGNPKIGHFPYKDDNLDFVPAHTFEVPLCELELDGGVDTCEPLTAFFAAHAVVHRGSEGAGQTETAWGDGQRITEQGSWAMYFNLELQCGVEEPPIQRCESAFAKTEASTCFINHDFDDDGAVEGFTRWGWTNGPIAPGTHEVVPVYANAKDCDTALGHQVGKLDVEYLAAGTVKLRFENMGDFVLHGEHLYLGNEQLPKDSATGEYTIDPNLYGIALADHDIATSRARTVEGLTGDLHLIYHAVACGAYEY